MRRIGFSAFFTTIFVLKAASAACFGANALQNCDDSLSNSYSISRFGDTMTMADDNKQAGSSWLHNSTTLTSITIHNDHASSGKSWNSTDQRLGEVSPLFDRNSQGNGFSRICSLLDRC
jgi:hypothetical protein